MFIIERYRLQNDASYAKNGVRLDGIRLAKTSIVKRGLSHRHIVLGIGICVALIVVLTLWASRKGLAVAFTTRVTTVLTSAQIPEVKDVVKKATSLSFDDLN